VSRGRISDRGRLCYDPMLTSTKLPIGVMERLDTPSPCLMDPQVTTVPRFKGRRSPSAMGTLNIGVQRMPPCLKCRSLHDLFPQASWTSIQASRF
jgi:hypothetical protein